MPTQNTELRKKENNWDNYEREKEEKKEQKTLNDFEEVEV